MNSHPSSTQVCACPSRVYEALRKIAFDERLEIRDVVLEGIDLALRRRGYPSSRAIASASHGVLDVAMAEIRLQGARFAALVGLMRLFQMNHLAGLSCGLFRLV
jgi:hypothetical protein